MSDEAPTVRSDDGALARIAAFCQLGRVRTGADAMTVAINTAASGLEVQLATDELSERVAELEQALGQGPGSDAVRTGMPTAADDLDSAVSSHRWPLFAPDAVQAGVRSIHAYPIILSRIAIGAVGLYSRHQKRLSTEQHRNALAATELIGLALVDAASSSDIGTSLRMTVHQAAGMIMVQTGMTISDALVRLRATAFAEDIKLTDLAADVVAGRRRFGKVGSDGND